MQIDASNKKESSNTLFSESKLEMHASIKMISDEELLQLWRDPNFAGSYKGVKSFKVFLKTDKNVDVPESRLYKILKKDPIFLIHQRPIRNFDRRSYDIKYYGETVQADIAYMFPFEKFLYFLLVIDCFSLKIFVKPLQSKSSNAVGKAFEEIFDEFNAPIHVLETDRGTEFIGCKKLFQTNKIFFKTKFGRNKAGIAEWGIFMIKKRLYMMLRGVLKQNWVDFLPIVVRDYNRTPSSKLGGITPESIHSEIDSVRVSEAQKNANINVYKEPSYKKQIENQVQYENDQENLQVNSYVYLTSNEDLFSKSYDVKVCFHLSKMHT